MMKNHEKLAQILGASAEELLVVDEKMSTLTGKQGVLDKVVQNNDENIERVLSDLGLTRSSTAEEVYGALTEKLLIIDKKLFELLDRPNLSKLSSDPGKIRDVALSVYSPSTDSTNSLQAGSGQAPKGLFIKKEKVVALLEKQPPQSLLEHFGYQNVSELVEKEGFASVVAALRFTQTTEWMHQFFDTAYQGLRPDDFEDRDVEIKILDTKWLSIAEKFIGKKFHNVSHLKEFGIIFISPDPIDIPGETLRMFVLLLHYLHEVPFYSGLFRKFLHDSDFVTKFQSLLRGDVLEKSEILKIKSQKSIIWPIIQRYLAKDNPDDPRLHEHHVDPEAEHWYRVAQNFGKLAEVMSARGGSASGGGDSDQFNISYWAGLDHVGGVFKNKESKDVLVSFDIVDLIMSLVKQGEVKYLYHQQEAMWNYIFSEYIGLTAQAGRDEMNRLIEENIVKGFIEL